MKPCLVIDIETRADKRLLDDPAYLEELESSFENRAIKDPLKQAAWRGDKLEKHVHGMALHPTTGKVVAVGVAWLDTPPAVMLDMDNEPFLLAEFANLLSDLPKPHVIAGFNIREFDIPYVTARCAINDIDLPDWWPYRRDWNNVADVMDLLGMKGTLTDWCRAFVINVPDVTGEAVTKLSEADLRIHCEQDLGATAAIIQRMARRFPALRGKAKVRM